MWQTILAQGEPKTAEPLGVVLMILIGVAILSAARLLRKQPDTTTPSGPDAKTKPEPTAKKEWLVCKVWNDKNWFRRAVALVFIGLVILTVFYGNTRAWDYVRGDEVVLLLILAIAALILAFAIPRITSAILLVILVKLAWAPLGMGVGIGKPAVNVTPIRTKWSVSYPVYPDRETRVDLGKITRPGDTAVLLKPTGEVRVRGTAKDPANPSGPPIKIPPFVSSPAGGEARPIIPYDATLYLESLMGEPVTMTIEGE